MNLWLDHESTSMDLASLNWLFLHAGAFGNREMDAFSKAFDQLSEGGKPCSYTK
jgi:hypothetical protein